MPYLLAFFLLFLANLSAQDKELELLEDFSDTSTWAFRNEELLKADYENGAYELNYMGKQTVYAAKDYGNLSSLKPWSCKLVFRANARFADTKFSILFAAKTENYAKYRISILPKQSKIQLEEVNGGVLRKRWYARIESGESMSRTDQILELYFDPKLEEDTKTGELSIWLNGSLLGKELISPHGGVFGLAQTNSGRFSFKKMELAGTFRQLNLSAEADNYSNIQKINLGDSVNTPYSEVDPLITADGKRLYYSIKKHPENTGGVNDLDEIWYSDLGEDGQWQKRVNIGPPLNNRSPNGVISISADGNMMYLRNRYLPNGAADLQNQGISYATKAADGSWNIPLPVEIEDYHNVGRFSEFCFSADEQYFIMTLIRKDDAYMGSKDIYASKRLANGTWSKPFNLGPVINSCGDESAPYLAADGKTLYFGSNGHAGYGSYDIFLSRRLDDTWTNWSVPENLGPAVNSAGWEAFFTIPASGVHAYLVEAGVLKGQTTDIVRIDMPQNLRPEPVVLMRGRVFHAETKEPLAADIRYSDLQSGDLLGQARSNPSDGSYTLVLPLKKVYDFLGEKEGFFPESQVLDLLDVEQEYAEIERDLYLSPIKQGRSIRLNNLFFDTNKYELRPESRSELKRLIALLEQYPSMYIVLEGHTDSRGSKAANQVLSENRAKAVYNYLIKEGAIDANRLSSKGYGPDKPSASNEDEAGRQLNRRVEFRITNINN